MSTTEDEPGVPPGDGAIVLEPIELAWPEQHQPLPHRSVRVLPPTQPSPLLNGLIEAVISTTPGTPASTVNSKLVGADNNPLTTAPAAAPTNTETLVVQLAPGQLYQAAGAADPLIATGGTITLPNATLATRITAISIGIVQVGATSLATAPAVVAFTLNDSAATVLAAGVVTAAAPWTMPFPSGLPVLAAGALRLSYGANLGSLSVYYTVSGTTP